MANKRKIKAISIARNGIANIKSPTIMLHTEPNIIEPLVYLRKPKHITDEQFEAVIDDLASQIVGLNSYSVSKLEEESNGE